MARSLNKQRIREALPEPAAERLRRTVHRMRRLRRPVRWGNLDRTRPFSDVYGAERGTPVDRVYIERFLTAHAADIRGTVLEVKDDAYTRTYGGDRVRVSEVVDADPENPEATFIADLSAEDALPVGRYDCVICTQTLHLIADVDTTLRNLYGALRPGGVLLLTAPFATKVEFTYEHAPDLWRFTPAGLRETIRRAIGLENVHVEHPGNLQTLTAFLHGLAAEEVDQAAFLVDDPRFPVFNGVRIARHTA